jgi:hypothetical protein
MPGYCLVSSAHLTLYDPSVSYKTPYSYPLTLHTEKPSAAITPASIVDQADTKSHVTQESIS